MKPSGLFFSAGGVSVNLTQEIIDATKDIFTSMVMMEISPGAPLAGEINPMHRSISGMVGMAGTHKGMLAIHIPEKVAMAITSNFLGLDVDEINEDVQDAIGELANMLGGSVKSFLSDGGKDIKLSLPSTIFGEEYTFQCPDEVDLILVPFAAPQGEFLVELRLESEA
jgi:chemotaxis protein CheX